MVEKRENKGCLVVFIVIAAVIIALVIGGFGYYMYLKSAVILDEEVTVTIPEGASTSTISGLLQEAGVVRSGLLFTLYARQENIDSSLKPGEYTFSDEKITYEDIAAILLEGKQLRGEQVVIPEGFTVKQIAARLVERGFVEEAAFWDYAENGDFSYDYLPAPGTENRLEGFLFPETYEILPDWTEREIIDAMLAQFHSVWTEEWQARAKELGYTPLEIVTIASMIERETSVDFERPIVAGVIYNRLEQGMMLQIDATIQYALGEQKDRLLYSDLEIDSPYNTYKIQGLPPGPIACPGAACIEAALYPEESDYLYYRTKNDGTGEHYFAETYEEHLANGER